MDYFCKHESWPECRCDLSAIWSGPGHHIPAWWLIAYWKEQATGRHVDPFKPIPNVNP